PFRSLCYGKGFTHDKEQKQNCAEYAQTSRQPTNSFSKQNVTGQHKNTSLTLIPPIGRSPCYPRATFSIVTMLITAESSEEQGLRHRQDLLPLIPQSKFPDLLPPT